MDPLKQAGLLELILDSLGEGVIVADKTGKIILFNPMAEKIAGQSADDTHYGEWSETHGIYCGDGVTLFPSDQLPLVRAIRGEATDEVEMFMQNPNIPDGVFLRATGRPLYGRHNELVGGVVVFRDVTSEVRSVHSFKEDAGRVLFDLATKDDSDLAAALRRATEADSRKLKTERVSIWLFNADHSAILCENLYTLSRNTHERGGELKAERYPRYFRALSESRTIDAADALNDSRTSEFREDYLKPLGIVSMLDVPIRLHGRVAGVVCHEHVGSPTRRWSMDEQEFAASIADLVSLALEAAERVKVERELEKNFSLLRATLESTADGILVVDMDGRIVSFNQKFVQMWRIPEAVLRTRDDDRAISFVLEQLKDPEAFLEKVRDLYAHSDSESFDVLDFKDGRVFERFSQPQRVGGKSVGRVWSFRDVTEKRRANEELHKACDELQKLNQIKTNFASMISHELKTPLAAIQESVGVIRDGLDGPVTAAQKKTLEIARLNAEWLARLINNFLTFSRIESGRMDMRFQRLDARSVVEECCRMLKPVAEKKGIKLTKSVPEAAVEVHWDVDRMRTLVLNLVENAIKYTDAPGEVHVRLACKDGDVALEVEDNGIGIREQDQASIFDLFAQAARQGPWRTGGFGIGLTICRYVAEHHGGSLSVASEHGKGSRFTARIPVMPPEASPEVRGNGAKAGIR
jgi:PAS domain S-box-containing protein